MHSCKAMTTETDKSSIKFRFENVCKLNFTSEQPTSSTPCTLCAIVLVTLTSLNEGSQSSAMSCCAGGGAVKASFSSWARSSLTQQQQQQQFWLSGLISSGCVGQSPRWSTGALCLRTVDAFDTSGEASVERAIPEHDFGLQAEQSVSEDSTSLCCFVCDSQVEKDVDAPTPYFLY